MKYFLIAIVVFVVSCDRKPYVEHKIKFEKTGDGCAGISSSFGLNSNFGGERYEFQKCLPADFSKDQVTASRQGDTVLIRFPKTEAGKKQASFAITLDIDSYPKYSYITIDEDTYTIVASN